MILFFNSLLISLTPIMYILFLVFIWQLYTLYVLIIKSFQMKNMLFSLMPHVTDLPFWLGTSCGQLKGRKKWMLYYGKKSRKVAAL